FLEAPAMYAEALEVILAGLRGGRPTHRGRYYRYLDVPIKLTPVPPPPPPLRQGVTSPASPPCAPAGGGNIRGTAPCARMREGAAEGSRRSLLRSDGCAAGRKHADGRPPATCLRRRNRRRGGRRRARRLQGLVRQPGEPLAPVQHGAVPLRGVARARTGGRRR